MSTPLTRTGPVRNDGNPLDWTLVIVRIWTLLLAVLLFAAPAQDMPAEIADSAAQMGQMACADEEAVTHAVIAVDLSSARRRVIAFIVDSDTPPSPALSRVFRPPRSSFV